LLLAPAPRQYDGHHQTNERAKAMAKAEFFFDVGSPASYIAAAQMDGLEARTGAQIIWRPMLLGGVFKATGNHSPAVIPAKSAWMHKDLAMHAARAGAPFAFNPFFPIDTIMMMRAAAAMELQGRLRAYIDPVFKAMWASPQNMGDPAVLGAVLSAAGFDPQEVLAAAQSQPAKERLRATTEEAVARGVFGAPTIFVGDQMFFGQDRLHFVEEALSKA
jgi:2-hydroxychromene-2-carboxylate isomerase